MTARKVDAGTKAINRLYNNWQAFLSITRRFAENDGRLFIRERERRAINGERSRLNSYRQALFDAGAAGDKLAAKYAKIMQFSNIHWEQTIEPDLVKIYWVIDPMALIGDSLIGEKLKDFLKEEPLVARPMGEERQVREIARHFMIDIHQRADKDGWVKLNLIFEKHIKEDGRSLDEVESSYKLLLEEKAIEEQSWKLGSDDFMTAFVKLLKPIISIELTPPVGNMPEDLAIELENEAIAVARRQRLKTAAETES